MNYSRFFFISSLTLALLLVSGYFYQRTHQQWHVNIAAGKAGSDSYTLIRALKKAVQRKHPYIHINLIASLGGTPNMHLLEAEEVGFATIQSDTVVTADIKMIARLYSNIFQFIVHTDSGIQALSELTGKSIAVPFSMQGRAPSFKLLMNHYGYNENTLNIIPMSDSAAEFALKQGAIDAIFRVAPPGNEKISAIIKQTPTRVLPIKQTVAIHLKNPSLHTDIIPLGSYSGSPPLPSEELPTVSIRKLLVAHSNAPNSVVKAITETLFEQKKELLIDTKLASFIQPPNLTGNSFLPIHSGAQRYFDRESPSFLEEQAEPMALILTVIVGLISLLLNLRAQRRQVRVKELNNELLKMLKKAESLHDKQQLQNMADRLNTILKNAVIERNEGLISAEDFDFFSFVWEMARDEVNERLPSNTMMKQETTL